MPITRLTSRTGVPNPNPSAAIELLCKIVDELGQAPYGWSPDSIHLFGFGQGGTLACETALQLCKSRQANYDLGSVVSMQGPLLSLPPQSSKPGSTKILFVYRAKTTVTSAKTKAEISALERAFTSVKTLRLTDKNGMASMPDSKAEWEGIMAFWSEHLQSSSSWQRQGEVYEVTGKQNPVQLPGELAAAPTLKRAANAQSGTASPSINASTPASVSAAKATPKAPSGLKRGFLSRGL
jgi:hypothetical protein